MVGIRKHIWPALIGWLVLCYSASIIGDIASPPGNGGDWYFSLNRPAFTPPGWVFKPVWTFLYTTMAFSVWRVWMLVHIRDKPLAFGLFGFQLLINMAWPIVFFRVQNLGLSFTLIVVLLGLIGVIFYLFRKIDHTASILLVPYFLWIVFSTVVMGGIFFGR